LKSPDKKETAKPQAAATLVIVRSRDRDLEVYLVKRHGKASFMPAHYVFPGGCLEEQDQLLAQRLSEAQQSEVFAKMDGVQEKEEATAFAIAAIRETAEESGLLLAYHENGEMAEEDSAHAVFEALRGGASFVDEVHKHKLDLAVDLLHPLAWWITPAFQPLRYDTRFFLAEAPPAQRARYDEIETTSGCWITPRNALMQFQQNALVLAPPTLDTLEQLNAVTTFAEARATVRLPIRPILPECGRDADGTPLLVLPGDPLFSIDSSPVLSHRTRFRRNEHGQFE
jgi:8-oxo-dGTP pyrophosphatase MutT (NUDIX family)